ncbi:hypothetical protein EZV62_003164 [Acer yangbiense]|uniref:Uncharacterized protein n=1 Tax=Acer yangbiense TaxID=1000413 RepID=A0A5C7IGT3_9ROSI|nr:hypothetical protein EZV62_003164 [Acer yangbiense]
MAVSEMRDVLNYLADENNVEYFIFGFNAHSQYWDDKENCVKGKLMDGGFQSRKIRVMMDYAISFGYKVEQPRYPRTYDPPIPPQHIAAPSSSG